MRMPPVPATLILAIVALGCAKPEAPPAETAASPAEPNVVNVAATEFSYTMPDTLPAGWTAFRMTNAGQQLHHVTIIKLEQGKTVDDLLAAMATPGPLPDWAVFYGGPNAVVGPMVSDVTVDIPAGNYAVICVIPSPDDGKPHVMKGMSKAVTVVPSDVVRAAPVEDVTLTLADYSFTWSAPLTAGKHVIKVENTAAQGHEFIFAQLAPGKTAADMMAFVEGLEAGKLPPGPPPIMPYSGISFMAPGIVNYITIDVQPGDYGELCVVPDAKDGKPHMAHGMVGQIKVM